MRWLPSVLSYFLVCVVASALAGCAARAPLPPQAVALNRRGAEALLASDLAAAESRFELALEYNPRFTEAWVNLGWVALQRGNFEQAAHHFARARSLNADLPTPHQGLGVLAERRGKVSTAEGHYRDALAVAPDFAEARMNLGRLLFARGAFDEAREQFARLTEVAPENPAGYLGLAEAYLKLDRVTEGEEALLRYRSRFGDTPEASLVVARQLLARGDHEAAERTLAPVTGNADSNVAARAWAWIAIARIEGGKRAAAQAATREALRFDATDPVALHAQTLVTASEGEPPQRHRAPR